MEIVFPERIGPSSGRQRKGTVTLIIGVLLFGVLLLAAGASWARRSYVVITVDGTSTTPTLTDGDRVLVRRRRLDRVGRGDVVVLEPPPDPSGRYMPGPSGPDGRHWNIKRVAALPSDPVPAVPTGRDSWRSSTSTATRATSTRRGSPSRPAPRSPWRSSPVPVPGPETLSRRLPTCRASSRPNAPTAW
ncbi:S26 family signal peptidase [Streptosporangium sp. NPDC049644]|uniref:S26 family signal peptidase n=1 Tax=Streptosporangium sp. NPDC049644 TaxID=3155507 RepID=UPI0034197761